MPDPLYARESIWLPFIIDTLCGGPASALNTVIIGHSSGAAAALRVAEAMPLRGLVLVAAYDSDLGDAVERGSGYFNRPFDWARIVDHCGFIIQFAGSADSLVPIDCQRGVAEKLSSAATRSCAREVRYLEQEGGDHFFDGPSFPGELFSEIDAAIRDQSNE